jgi:hypothetical protein
MKNQPMHFYLFKGNCVSLFEELVEMLQPNRQQEFVFWESKDKTKDHSLIIVYGMPLADSYCYQRNIWKTDEKIFNSFYKPKVKQFKIHDYKELGELPSVNKGIQIAMRH